MWLWLFGTVCVLLGLYLLLTHIYQEEEKALRSTIRKTVKETFPDRAEKYSETIGLFRQVADHGASKPDKVPGRNVVLIHGLDDPGKVWQDLTPALLQEGYDVWQFEYPNDQPLGESAALFFDELHALKSHGIEHIDIVAHSMGGLISRELLTSPDIDYSRFIEEQQVPRIDTLIMVGTPNHGSPMVRLRFFAEMRDQFTRLVRGQTEWLTFIFDGAGEAKIDLLPGSRFLEELNSRPYPEGVEQFIIAGVTSPWSEEELVGFLDGYTENLPGLSAEDLRAIKTAAASMTDGLGDGLVSVESTRLPGITHTTVPGTHLSMIRNVTPNSERIPPAIPIIIKQLQNNENTQT